MENRKVGRLVKPRLVDEPQAPRAEMMRNDGVSKNSGRGLSQAIRRWQESRRPLPWKRAEAPPDIQECNLDRSPRLPDEPPEARAGLVTIGQVSGGRGWLKNGNLPGDPSAAPRCGAHARSGKPCRAPALRGKKRCRLHGGLSTGPRTPEGLARSRRARWIHGRYSEEAKAERIEAAEIAKIEEEGRSEARKRLAPMFRRQAVFARRVERLEARMTKSKIDVGRVLAEILQRR